MTTLLAALLAGVAAESTCYALIFATQDTPAGIRPSLRSIHSFAHFVAVDSNGEIMQECTVSWVAANKMRFWAGPQRGMNLSLEESLESARQNGWRVSMWGPYRVSADAFDRALAQSQRLSSAEQTGLVKYKLLDRQTRSSSRWPAFHCVHALTQITGAELQTGAKAGIEASEYVVRAYLQRGIILGEESGSGWVWDRVRPGGYEVANQSLAVPPIEPSKATRMVVDAKERRAGPSELTPVQATVQSSISVEPNTDSSTQSSSRHGDSGNRDEQP